METFFDTQLLGVNEDHRLIAKGVFSCISCFYGLKIPNWVCRSPLAHFEVAPRYLAALAAKYFYKMRVLAPLEHAFTAAWASQSDLGHHQDNVMVDEPT